LRYRIAFCTGCLLALTACPVTRRPFGQPEYVTAQVTPYVKRETAPPRQGNVLVLGALDDASFAPQGGAYDEEHPLMVPLDSTFAYWALPEKLLDGLQGALARRGQRTLKDYLDLGAPVPFPQPRFPAGLLVLRGTIEHFSLSRIVGGTDVLMAGVSWRLLVGDTGDVLWQGRNELAFRIGWPSPAEPFDVAADALAAALLGDPAFVAALERRGQ
jgi:hypothetical protein